MQFISQTYVSVYRIRKDTGGISQAATLLRPHENFRRETASLLSGRNNGKVNLRIVTPQTSCLDGREGDDQSQSTVEAKNSYCQHDFCHCIHPLLIFFTYSLGCSLCIFNCLANTLKHFLGDGCKWHQVLLSSIYICLNIYLPFYLSI